MNRSVLGIILALVAVLIIGAFVIASNRDEEAPATTSSQTQSASDTEPTAQEFGQGNASEASQSASVEIRDSSFSPSTIRVKKGGTVTWTNRDNIQHDVTPDEASGSFRKSDLLSQGESYSATFNTAGNYTYFCTPHPFMKGTVEVVE